MNKQFAKYAGGVTLLVGLVAYIAQAAIRLNAIEEKAAQVPEVVQNVKILKMYIKLIDPEGLKKAEELAR